MGSVNGVSGAVHDIEVFEEDDGGESVLIGGQFTSAGGYSNNDNFAVFMDAEGWGMYYAYPSKAGDGNYSKVESIDPQPNGSFLVQGDWIYEWEDMFNTYQTNSSMAYWWPSYGFGYWSPIP
ncbi:MAG: hypothetical protein H8E20_15995 [Verrucomicrobia bacterium]|nr:hypothetical protein [Verrucomicrobiota bacterium]